MLQRIRRWFRREDPQGKHRPSRDPHAPRHERPHKSPGQRWLEGDFDYPDEDDGRHE